MMRTDKNGNQIEEGFICDPEGDGMYVFESKLTDKHWRRFMTRQDAHYFGVWINDSLRQTASYCEGDTYLTRCATEESYQKELDGLREFHKPPNPDKLHLLDNGQRITVEIPYNHDGMTEEGRELMRLAFS